jgi:antitoxin VapB
LGGRRYCVALSIKNSRAELLAKELARESGMTVTSSVIDALEQALVRVRGRRTAPSVRDAILEVSERCAALPDVDTRTAEEILGYDKSGAFA